MTDALHSKDPKKAWAGFNALCDEMQKLGILKPNPVDRLGLSKQFQDKVLRLFEHPINVEAAEALRRDPKHFFDVCAIATLVGYYGEIAPDKLEPRWKIVNGLFTLSQLDVFREQNR